MSKPFSAALALIQGGAFNDECGAKLAEVIKGVEETGRPGKLTITLDLKRAGAALQVIAKCTDKTPEEVADADLFWSTVDGNLSIENPAQRKLDLQPVPSTTRVLNTGA
jgi:hypothetical protein